jgi:hypothetical protein
VQRLRHDRERLRQRVTDRVLEALLSWQSGMLALRFAELPDEQVKAWALVLRAETELFVLTGGWSDGELPPVSEPSPTPPDAAGDPQSSRDAADSAR